MVAAASNYALCVEAHGLPTLRPRQVARPTTRSCSGTSLRLGNCMCFLQGAAPDLSVSFPSAAFQSARSFPISPTPRSIASSRGTAACAGTSVEVRPCSNEEEPAIGNPTLKHQLHSCLGAADRGSLTQRDTAFSNDCGREFCFIHAAERIDLIQAIASASCR